MAADWAKIEAEYITTNLSYRELADKYGLDQATVSRKGKTLDWVGKRQRHVSETQAEVISRDKDIKADIATELTSTAKLILSKMKAGIESREDLTPSEAKGYSSAVKDIKDIFDIRSEDDKEEQRARIEKLRRDFARDDKSSSITVTLEGGLAEYGR
jgi:hypothetical protein